MIESKKNKLVSHYRVFENVCYYIAPFSIPFGFFSIPLGFNKTSNVFVGIKYFLLYFVYNITPNLSYLYKEVLSKRYDKNSNAVFCISDFNRFRTSFKFNFADICNFFDGISRVVIFRLCSGKI